MEIIDKRFNSSNDVKQYRYSIAEEARELIKKASREGRELSPKENVVFENLQNEISGLDKLVLDYEAREKKELDQAWKEARKVSDSPVSKSGWFDFNQQRSIPVYRKGEKIQSTDNALSIGRAVRALITGNWKGAEAEQRAFSTSSGNGLLVPVSVMENVLDLARAKSVVFAAGGLMVPMQDSKMTLAKVLEDASFETKAENELFSANDLDFDGIELEAKTIGAVVKLSRELAADASNVAQAIEATLANSLASYLDYLAIFGSGIDEVRGILATTGIQTEEVDSVLSYSHLLNAWAKVAGANGNPATIALSPRDMAKVAGSVNDYNDFLNRPSLLSEMQWLHSSVFPTDLGTGENESVGIVGDFSQVVWGIRQNALIEINNAGDQFNRHQVGVKITFRGDVAVLRPDHFCRLTGLKATVPAPPPNG